MTELTETLVEFYGDGCTHCKEMKPKVEKLEEEEGVTVQKLEVWDDEDNQELYYDVDGDDKCGGVPFFYNTETEEWICGGTDYETLKAWANGEEVNN